MRILAPLLALAFLAACNMSRVSETSTQSIPVSGPAQLRVDNVAGTVRVNAWDKPVVQIEAKKYAESQDALKYVNVSVEHSGSSVTVKTSYSQPTSNGGVEFTISLPAGSSVEVNNIAGTVNLDGIGGNVNVQSQAGTIEASLPRVEGDRSVILHATTGAITLTIPKDSDATVHAGSTVGAFSTDFSIPTSRSSMIGAVADGKLGTGSARIDLSTTTGAIDLRAAP
jgi:hypothetical protein